MNKLQLIDADTLYYSLLIQITAFYGLRRSEALGLRWDAIDFERNTTACVVVRFWG